MYFSCYVCVADGSEQALVGLSVAKEHREIPGLALFTVSQQMDGTAWVAWGGSVIVSWWFHPPSWAFVSCLPCDPAWFHYKLLYLVSTPYAL